MMLKVIEKQPVIKATEFDMRPLRFSDAGLIELAMSDGRVAKNTCSIPHPLPPGSAMAMIERADRDDRKVDMWAMDGTKTGLEEVMGLVSLARIDCGQSEISYWVSPAYWNTGVASSAVETLLETNPQNCRTIVASVFQDNPASARVLTNCGFEYLGDAEAFCIARGNKVPTWTYTIRLDCGENAS
ncbi:MAG: GNAT family protein [Roseovarius sp.]|nr:GNAT family protein [Roseovarius sp.]MCY4206948.1 GNAT family protein [Roseovarius sp.]MCY4292028.1 GNAT family protein [Roseovarius sp.]MCY4315755.1 GNAT family protein [Roseovarius sp.]